ncbi:MAG: 3-phosphoshikimate 1-carboxyvinyltransferase [Deltaproteobacteria bacterium]|nr:3-phosphoshikimate 1-carboxyvinyltransferase [Deltaproteobacteria bacterium]
MSMKIRVRKSPPLKGVVRVPGDKSISHRAVMLSAIAEGRSRISGFLDGGDCRATVSVMRDLGVHIEKPRPNELIIHGLGLHGLKTPAEPLDCDNSGTTMRLMTGILAGQSFASRLIGTMQLSGRPMNRIIKPLALMGAEIGSRDGKAPLDISSGHGLKGIEYNMPVASAQLKSCILVAGLYAEGSTILVEKGPSRDHTERMLRAMGARVRTEGRLVTIAPQHEPLIPLEVEVPGDMSSAAFLLVAASVVPKSEITLLGVGVNPTRMGIVQALKRMGGDIRIENEHDTFGEPVADVTVRHATLEGADFDGDEIVTMIDELPVLAVAAASARGKTTIRGARELRVKETDRVATTAEELVRLGAKVTTLEDGMIIEGGASLEGTAVKSHGDHRLAMLLTIAGLVCEGETIVDDAHVTADSFPGFEACLESLGVPIEVDRK